MSVVVDTECRVCKNKKIFNIVDCDVETFRESYITKDCNNCKNSTVTILKVRDSSKSNSFNEVQSIKKTTFFEWVGMSGVLVFWIFIAIALIAFVIEFFSQGSTCVQGPNICSGDILGP